MTPELETTIYRLVQEALTNAVKHAKARKVEVVVADVGGEITVEVRDDGVGFELTTDSPGFGLTGMRERVALAGGALTIDSSASGTSIRANLGARRQRGAAPALRAYQPDSRPRRSA